MSSSPAHARPATAAERLIVALDTPSLEDAVKLARELRGSVGMVKVGLELFAASGPRAVEELRGAGLPVFLDLKLHDIPNTVRSAAREAARLGVTLLTVHASGGSSMVEAAAEGAEAGASHGGLPPPCVLAVTVLTSMDGKELESVGLEGPPRSAVERLARLALGAGAGGIVCSPEEAAVVRSTGGFGPLIVTPGVRPAGSAADDQSRVATPSAAVAAGADYLVIGRPIRSAADPRAAAEAIAEEIRASSPEPDAP